MYKDITPEKIRKEIIDDIGANLDTSEGTFISDVVSAVSRKIWDAYQDMNNILDIAFMKTSDGDYVIKKAEEEGIFRKESQFSYGKLEFEGEAGTEFFAGVICQTKGGLKFVTEEGGTFDDEGKAVASAVSYEKGSKYNVEAGSITEFATMHANIYSVTNSEAFIGGKDEETIEELKERYFEKKKANPTSGNEDYYKSLVKTVDGVDEAKTIRRWNGNGTLKVILIGKDNTIVNSEIVDKASLLVEENRIVDASVTVISAVSKEISISADVVISGVDIESVKMSAENAIKNYFKTFDDNVIYASKINSLIMGIEGVKDVRNVLLNEIDSVDISKEEVPGLINVTLNSEV